MKFISNINVRSNDSFLKNVENMLYKKEYEDAINYINDNAKLYEGVTLKKQALNGLKLVHENLYNDKQWDGCCVLEEIAEVLLGDIHFFDTSELI